MKNGQGKERGPVARGITGQGIKKCLRHFIDPCPSDDGLSYKVKKPRRNGGWHGNEMQNQKQAVYCSGSDRLLGGCVPSGGAAPDSCPRQGAD